MSIPNEWVEKGARALVEYSINTETEYPGWRDAGPELPTGIVLQAVLPDILEAVAREIEKGLPDDVNIWNSPEKFRFAHLSHAAQIVRNFGAE